jgi:phosphate-selective porin OprO/OprP
MQNSFRVSIALIPVVLLAVAAPLHAQTDTPPTKVDASQGGVTFSSGPNNLTIGARMQFRWTLDGREAVDLDASGSGVGSEDGLSSQFDVPRMRVTLSGGVYRSWLRYQFQFDFGRTSGESASKIKDAYLEIRPSGAPVRVRLGQFKAPFGLQQLTSSGRLQFVDRAITDSKFNPSRDMGVMLTGTAASRKLGYDAGVFNGSGESVRQNTRSHLLTGRIYLQPFGTYSLSEGSSDMAEDASAVLHLGAGARTGKQIRGRTASGIFEDADDQSAFNGEFAFKMPRFFSTAEFFWMRDEQDNPVDSRTIHSRGFHAQAGYMLLPRRLEAGLLFARITPDTEVDDAEVTELRGVIGYYWRAHNLKLQADLGRLGYAENFGALSSRARQGLPSLGPRLVSGESLADTQLRIQMQVSF